MKTTETNWQEIAAKVAHIHRATLPAATDPILCRRIYRLHKTMIGIDDSMERRGLYNPVLIKRRQKVYTELTSLLKMTKTQATDGK